MAGGGDFSKFNPQAYLEQYFSGNLLMLLPLKHLHEFYRRWSGDKELTTAGEGLSVLDLGCGPAIAHAFVSSLFVSEIVMADYLEQNRKELRKWLNDEEDAVDWSSILSHIVTQIEGKGSDTIPGRVAIFKRAVKAVVHCNVLEDPMIPCHEYMKEYDVVQTLLCLQTACTIASEDEYKSAIKRIMESLLKPGGTLVQYVIIGEKRPSGLMEYAIGDVHFYDLCITMEFALQCLTTAGFINIETVPVLLSGVNETESKVYSTFLITASKPSM